MTITELKQRIHEKVDSSTDVELLEKINMLVSQKEDVFQIPEHVLQGIRQGMEDIKNGDFLTLEELEKRYEKWLKD
ncbi:hypothetical protein EOD41_07130 [Mucilaginibacter limnophilus]|uniref:Uncharacterized protein n=1 Tax=Mucilaginibacter limnophilus TaxID=1932778 RepID=A0A437MVS0_9SPHI|nr:hypothetical protein [Mucilaginibacter limnophilus]RVU01726.1 hypothetical protein EOD41_07130 [Mucilaginibacter limnophilus]